MANEALSMTFATVFSMQVEGQTLPTHSAQAAFHMAVPDTGKTQPAQAHYPYGGGKEPPKQPLQTIGPAGSTATKESGLATMKRDRRFPRQVELVIFNTERMPREYMEDMLKRVFHENNGSALTLSYRRHIHEGPFTKDVARTKADSVRLDAERNNVPVPQMRYVAVKRTM